MAPQRLFFFGDQLSDSLPCIRNLFHVSKSLPTVRRFLREATDVFQTNLAALKLQERDETFAVGTLQDLAEQVSKQDVPDALIATVLMCIARLGELIIYVENDPSMLKSGDPELHILGLCTGLAVAKDTSELLKLAIEMVAVSFRLGYEMDMRAKRIEDARESWGYTVVGINAEECQQILDEFHQIQDIPTHRQTYVAVISRTWITVFGPPSTLSRLWLYSPSLEQAPKLNLASGAAVHAAHLPLLDVAKILGHTNRPFECSDLRTLLAQVIEDITQNAYNLDATVHTTVGCLKSQEGVELTVVGPTAHAIFVQGALKTAGVEAHITPQVKKSEQPQNLRDGSDLVAIVGMSGRFPGSDNVEGFWETLRRGQDLHTKIPESRFDLKAHYDPEGTIKNTLTTQYGCFLDQPGLFDCRLFNVSPREATQMDPFQRLLLLASYEAMEMAGYTQGGSLSTKSSRIATYMGQTTDDWRANNECQGIDVHFIPGVARAFTSGRLNYHFKWQGASYSLDSACSSSSTAVMLACSSLLARECDTALAGGGSVLSAPSLFAGLSRGGFLSPTGSCKTFSDDADGYCRGEAVGVVVLKRLEDAISDNDNIQAVIRASARASSTNAPSITQPDPDAQSKLYKQTLQQGCIDPAEIGYVEMHGTGTQLGDLAEVQSVAEVFGKGRSKDNPLVIGAVKANVGHGEAAAGITSLIKMVMMLRENWIPPQPGMPFEMNHKFPPLDRMNIKIAQGSMPFEANSKSDGKRKLLLNNFDAAGGNTCLIIEDPPEQQPKGQDPRTHHVVTCSARTSYSLRENKQRLLQHLTSHPQIKFSDVAYTTTARRLHDVFRSSYSAGSTEELTRLIEADLAESETKRASTRSSIVFTFTGQGSAYPGMGHQLFKSCSRFRQSIYSYQEICDSQGLPRVVDAIADSHGEVGPVSMVQSQLAIVFLELALADLWKSWGILPDLLIGHSLGEYSALCVSGVLSVSDTLHLVGRRSMMVQQRCSQGSHSMLAVGGSLSTLTDLLASRRLPSCEISCINAPGMTIVSGTNEDLKHLQSHLQVAGTKSTFLKVPYGFHSSQMDPILMELESNARGIRFAKPLIPIASTLTGTIVEELGTFTPTYLARQAREPVNFIGALQSCKSSGLIDEQTLWIEIGPEAVCLGMVRSTLDIQSARLLPTIKYNVDNWKTISNSIATAYNSKANINWPEYHKEYVGSQTLLELPTYAFDVKNYWARYRQEDLVPETMQPVSGPTNPNLKSMLTTCLQYVGKESSQGGEISTTFMSHTSEPRLLETIQGHLVDGIALCPASVFSDMAFSAAKYIYKKSNPAKVVPTMVLWNLEITHALVVPTSNPEQLIEATAIMGTDRSVNVTFGSREGSSSHEHGTCQVRFAQSEDLKTDFSRSLPLVRKRIDTVVNSAKAGLGHRLLKPIVYKLFSSLVLYNDKYRSIEEVFLDSEYGDAVATIKLRPSVGMGNFTFSPYWIDGIVHVAGFLLNGNPTKPEDVAYISTGFESLRIVEELSEDKFYTSYVSMQALEKKGSIMSDVYVFDGDRLVAVCAGMIFQRMTKTILHAIIGMAPSAAASRQRAGNDTPHRKEHRTVISPASESNNASTPASSASPTHGNSSSVSSIDDRDEGNLADHLLALVASETGYDIEEMEPSKLFSDMGVDSLMSIAITSAVKRQFGVELPASYFNDHPKVSDVRSDFEKDLEPEASFTSPSPPSPRLVSLPAASLPPLSQEVSGQVEETTRAQPVQIPSASSLHSPVKQRSPPESNVVLIQGRASSNETPLFLLTDGAGSAAAYIHLPSLPNSRRVYALESPFLQNPSEYNCSMEEMGALFLSALRKQQPHGPYILGGWSAGAAYAYEVSSQLLSQNEKIHCLFLIDMHVPTPMNDALSPAIELIDETNRYRGNQQPTNERLKKQNLHLLNTVKALIPYDPSPLDPSRSPGKTIIIWARRALGEKEGSSEFEPGELLDVDEAFVTNDSIDVKTRLKSWFFGKRTHFGPHGWDKLIRDPECCSMEGDHLSMVKQPEVKVLGQLLKQGIERSLTAKN